MAWIVDTVRRTSTELNLRSSGQEPIRVTQLLFDDALFANAIEVTSWDEERFQVSVCEACAVEGCATGGWSRLRVLDEAVVFLPCFDELTSEDSWERAQSTPPGPVLDRGVPVLKGESLARLRSFVPALPAKPAPLTEAELADVLRFEAPRSAFRRTADGPVLHHPAFIASAAGDLADLLEVVDSRLERLSSSRSPARVRPLADTDRPIHLFLDDRRLGDWAPVVETEDGGLQLTWGGFVLEEHR